MIGSLFFLLLATAPADFGVSPLMDPSHEHDWVQLSDEPDVGLWWDRNSIRESAFNGTTYPTVLMRGLFGDTDGAEAYRDILSAVDCAGDRIGAFDVLTVSASKGAPVRQTLTRPRFEASPGVDEVKKAQAMMRAACGEGWKP